MYVDLRLSGVVFGNWRPADVDEPTKARDVRAEVQRTNETCVSNALDALLDSLLLGYSDALVLPIASTFSLLSKVIATSRGRPHCAFLSEQSFRKPSAIHAPMRLQCFRKHRSSPKVTAFDVMVPPQGARNAFATAWWPPHPAQTDGTSSP